MKPFLFFQAETYLSSINSNDMRREIYTITDSSRPVPYKVTTQRTFINSKLSIHANKFDELKKIRLCSFVAQYGGNIPLRNY